MVVELELELVVLVPGTTTPPPLVVVTDEDDDSPLLVELRDVLELVLEVDEVLDPFGTPEEEDEVLLPLPLLDVETVPEELVEPLDEPELVDVAGVPPPAPDPVEEREDVVPELPDVEDREVVVDVVAREASIASTVTPPIIAWVQLGKGALGKPA